MPEYIKTSSTTYKAGEYTVKLMEYHSCLFRAYILLMDKVVYVTDTYTLETEAVQIAFNYIRDLTTIRTKQ